MNQTWLLELTPLMALSAKARARKKATGLRNKRSLACIVTRNLQCDQLYYMDGKGGIIYTHRY